MVYGINSRAIKPIFGMIGSVGRYKKPAGIGGLAGLFLDPAF